MNKSIEALKHEFASIRTGRASVALLDKVMVDYYGSPSPINQVANISVPEPRMIVIAPWDKTMIGAIEKAILQSDLGLNPGNDGAQIRLTIPQLTEERRKEIVKVVHKKAEDAKVAVRNIRRDVNDALKKEEKAKTIAKSRLQAAHIPFKVMIGASFNRFFEIADEGFYVARITKVDECLHILVYRPMIASDFGHSIEVDYAKEII